MIILAQEKQKVHSMGKEELWLMTKNMEEKVWFEVMEEDRVMKKVTRQ